MAIPFKEVKGGQNGFKEGQLFQDLQTLLTFVQQHSVPVLIETC